MGIPSHFNGADFEKCANDFMRLMNSAEGEVARMLDKMDSIFDGTITAKNWSNYVKQYGGESRTEDINVSAAMDLIKEIRDNYAKKLFDAFKNTENQGQTEAEGAETTDSSVTENTVPAENNNNTTKLPKKRPSMGLDNPSDYPSETDSATSSGTSNSSQVGLPKKADQYWPNGQIKVKYEKNIPPYSEVKTEYNQEGRVTSKTYYGENHKISRKSTDDGFLQTETFYDEKGRPCTESVCFNGKQISLIMYSYDENGNETRIEKSYDNDGNEVNETKYINGVKSKEVNGEIEDFGQGQVGDCWLCAGLKALSDKEWGRKYIKNAIKQLPNGDYEVTLKGAKSKQKKFIVTAEELQRQNNYSNGDPDALVIELAVEKYRKQYGETLDGGYGEEIFRLITGSYNTISHDIYETNAKANYRNMLNKYKQNPEKYAFTFALPMVDELKGAFGVNHSFKERSDYGTPHEFAVVGFRTDSSGKTWIKYVNPWDTSRVLEIEESDLINNAWGMEMLREP